MRQVKCFTDPFKNMESAAVRITDELNKWLAQNDNATLVDIKVEQLMNAQGNPMLVMFAIVDIKD